VDGLISAVRSNRVRYVPEGELVFVVAEVLDFDLSAGDFALFLIKLPFAAEGIIGRPHGSGY
jgi:hypothetical protein